MQAELRLVIGEWSLAVNHDQLLDLSQPQTRAELAQLFKEHLQAPSSPRTRPEALSLGHLYADGQHVPQDSARAVAYYTQAHEAGDWDATVATFSSIIGAAILATPYAFTLAGSVAVPLIIFLTLSNG